MELPPVQAKLRDKDAGMTYEVCAYREITREEALYAIRAHNAAKKPKPKRGSVVRIITTLGAHD